MSAPAPMVAARESWTPPHLAGTLTGDAAVEAVGRVERALADLLATNPSALMLVRDMVQVAVSGAAYPEVTRVPDADPVWDGDDERPTLWLCPWCATVGPSVVAVDVSERWTPSEVDGSDDESRTVGFVYDDPGEHHGSHFQSECCGKPVSLPEGWEEE